MEKVYVSFNYDQNNQMVHLLKALDKIKIKYKKIKIYATNNHNYDVEIISTKNKIVNFFNKYNYNNKKYIRNN